MPKGLSAFCDVLCIISAHCFISQPTPPPEPSTTPKPATVPSVESSIRKQEKPLYPPDVRRRKPVVKKPLERRPLKTGEDDAAAPSLIAAPTGEVSTTRTSRFSGPRKDESKDLSSAAPSSEESSLPWYIKMIKDETWFTKYYPNVSETVGASYLLKISVQSY